MKRLIWIVTLMLGPALLAEDELAVQEAFHPKIDAWVEGVVMSVDVQSGRLSVRGIRGAYATLYADMLREIDAKTANMSDDERARKTAEIRRSYNERFVLAKASDANASRDIDFTFYLPEKDGRLVVLNELDRYSRLEPEPQVCLTDSERRALRKLQDIRVGERVVVGFNGGVVFNNAYLLMRVPEGKPIPASFRIDAREIPQPEPEPAIASNDLTGPSKSDLETTRLIRENITQDKSLSALARDVQVSTLQGQVTLRGAVANENEKRVVFNMAAARVGESRITNELTVQK